MQSWDHRSVGLEVLEEVLGQDDDHAQADEHCEHEDGSKQVAGEATSSHALGPPYGRVV
jgi:hypothetical protein